MCCCNIIFDTPYYKSYGCKPYHWIKSLAWIPLQNFSFFPWNSSKWHIWCWLLPSKETNRRVVGLRTNLFEAWEYFVWILLHWKQTQWALARDAVWYKMLYVEDSVNKAGVLKWSVKIRSLQAWKWTASIRIKWVFSFIEKLSKVNLQVKTLRMSNKSTKFCMPPWSVSHAVL